MKLEITDKHALLNFTSLDDLADHTDRTAKGHRRQRVKEDPEWHGGVKDMDELTKLARTGLTQDGIDALRLSEQNIEELDRDLIKQTFKAEYSETGSDVDVARYLSGEQECMINYQLHDTVNTQRVVTLAVGIAVHCGIDPKAVTKHGQALMSLVEAIDRTGLQTEMWADCSIKASAWWGGDDGGSSYTGRVKVLLKSPGQILDPGAFMFMLTHVGAFRGLVLSAIYEFPREWRDAMRIMDGGGHGQPINQAYRIAEDYPEGTIYIPSISEDGQAGKALNETLKKLNLLNA